MTCAHAPSVLTWRGPNMTHFDHLHSYSNVRSFKTFNPGTRAPTKLEDKDKDTSKKGGKKRVDKSGLEPETPRTQHYAKRM